MAAHRSDPETASSMASDRASQSEKAGNEGTLGALLWVDRLNSYGVETRGIAPVPASEKTQASYLCLSAFWFSLSWTILPISVGFAGPLSYGLSVRDSCLVILFINLLCNVPPAWMSMWGVRLGLRGMVFSRYSFGSYGLILPVIFNLASMIGFSILNTILAGQTMSSVTGGRMSESVGCVVIAVTSLALSFMGKTVLHWYERLAFLPVVITSFVALGLSASYFADPAPAPLRPAEAPAVLSFVSIIAGFVLTWSGLSSDFSTYMRRESLWTCAATYAGLVIPNVLLQSLGAAIAACVPNVPAWSEGYDGGSAGGLLRAVLHRAGGFGDFLTVLLALSVVANVAATFYSVSLNFQVILPFTERIPRYFWAIVSTAIVLPISIVGAHHFYSSLSNLLGLIGYWSTAYIAILTIEHFAFRRADFAAYDPADWDSPSRLPWGVAAASTLACAFGAAVPAMGQVWYVGPVAEHTGDVGILFSFVVATLLYPPLRTLEIKLAGRR